MWRLSVYEFLKHFQVIKQKKENITLSLFTGGKMKEKRGEVTYSGTTW